MLIGLLYGFIFWKIGQWTAKKYEMGTVARISVCVLIYLVIFTFHLILTAVLTGREIGTEASLVAIMATGAFFYTTRRQKPADG